MTDEPGTVTGLPSGRKPLTRTRLCARLRSTWRRRFARDGEGRLRSRGPGPGPLRALTPRAPDPRRARRPVQPALALAAALVDPGPAAGEPRERPAGPADQPRASGRPGVPAAGDIRGRRRE